MFLHNAGWWHTDYTSSTLTMVYLLSLKNKLFPTSKEKIKKYCRLHRVSTILAVTSKNFPLRSRTASQRSVEQNLQICWASNLFHSQCLSLILACLAASSKHSATRTCLLFQQRWALRD